MTHSPVRARRTVPVVSFAAALAAAAALGGGVAHADVPAAWQEKTNVCQTASLYAVNPAYNPGATPDHQISGHKRLWWTSGEVVNGWWPVYSAGQDGWHTQWMRGECLTDGWVGPDDGHVDY